MSNFGDKKTKLTEKISTLVSEQVPEFLQSEEYATFIDFVEAYFQWMEKDAGVVETITGLVSKYQNVDETDSTYLNHLADQFMRRIPQDVVVDRRLLIKNIKEFYRAKGTEGSYQFLFRILFDEPSSLYFPKKDILYASDGDWVRRKIIKVVSYTGDPADFESRQITQKTSGASATVSDVTKYVVSGRTFYELELDRNTISGTFDVYGKIYANDDAIVATISPVLIGFNFSDYGAGYTVGDNINLSQGEPNVTSNGAVVVVETLRAGSLNTVKINNTGSGYSVGDPLYFLNSGTEGINAQAYVDSVNSTGGVTRIKIIDGGTGYVKNPKVYVTETYVTGPDDLGTDFTVSEIIVGAVSGAKAIVVEWNSESRTMKAYRYSAVPFNTGEKILGRKSGANVILNSQSGKNADIQIYGTNVGGIGSVRIVDPGQDYFFSPDSISTPGFSVADSVSSECTISNYLNKFKQVKTTDSFYEKLLDMKSYQTLLLIDDSTYTIDSVPSAFELRQAGLSDIRIMGKTARGPVLQFSTRKELEFTKEVNVRWIDLTFDTKTIKSFNGKFTFSNCRIYDTEGAAENSGRSQSTFLFDSSGTYTIIGSTIEENFHGVNHATVLNSVINGIYSNVFYECPVVKDCIVKNVLDAYDSGVSYGIYLKANTQKEVAYQRIEFLNCRGLSFVFGDSVDSTLSNSLSGSIDSVSYVTYYSGDSAEEDSGYPFWTLKAATNLGFNNIKTNAKFQVDSAAWSGQYVNVGITNSILHDSSQISNNSYSGIGYSNITHVDGDYVDPIAGQYTIPSVIEATEKLYNVWQAASCDSVFTVDLCGEKKSYTFTPSTFSPTDSGFVDSTEWTHTVSDKNNIIKITDSTVLNVGDIIKFADSTGAIQSGHNIEYTVLATYTLGADSTYIDIGWIGNSNIGLLVDLDSTVTRILYKTPSESEFYIASSVRYSKLVVTKDSACDTAVRTKRFSTLSLDFDSTQIYPHWTGEITEITQTDNATCASNIPTGVGVNVYSYTANTYYGEIRWYNNTWEERYKDSVDATTWTQDWLALDSTASVTTTGFLNTIDSCPLSYQKTTLSVLNNCTLLTETTQAASDVTKRSATIYTICGTLSNTTKDTVRLNSSASSVDDVYNNSNIKITLQNGVDIYRNILDYNGTTKIATVDTSFTGTQLPQAGDSYCISGTQRGALLTEAGYYSTGSGFLSSEKFLEDNIFYQPYSYQLRATEPIGKFKRVLMDVLHPAGMYFAPQVLVIPENQTEHTPEHRTYGQFEIGTIIQTYKSYIFTDVTTNPNFDPTVERTHPNEDNVLGIAYFKVTMKNLYKGTTAITGGTQANNFFVPYENIQSKTPVSGSTNGTATVASWEWDSATQSGTLGVTVASSTGFNFNDIIRATGSNRKATIKSSQLQGDIFKDIRIQDINTLRGQLYSPNLPDHSISLV